jgi:hypothetical protein
MIKSFLICLVICLGLINTSIAQKPDTSKQAKANIPQTYFIITAGEVIKAFYKDKPLSVETVAEFNDYVVANVKSLRDSWVVLTGKPGAGTYNEVLKILNRNRFKHISKNITAD